MANLSSQTNNYSMVINLPKDNSIKLMELINKLDTFCMNNTKEYFFIVHDKDINENGELKTVHIHLLFSSKKCRLLTMIKRVAVNIFGKDDFKTITLISCDIWREHDLGIQYLIHKNDKEKYQYDIKEVFTNDKEYLKSVVDYQVETKLNIGKLINLCYQYDSILDVFMEIGLANSKNYLNLINAIYNRIHKLPF